MKRTITLTAAVTAAALTFTCGDNVIINGEIPPPVPTSPANVLKNVEISFNQRDIDLLKRGLSTNFVYYADPGELGRPRPEGTPSRPPPIYSFTEFWHIAYNMFNRAYAITLSIPTGRVGEPEPEETTYRAGDVSVSLLVMVDELNGLKIDEGFCAFAFEAYYNEQKEKRWRLTGWWDFTSGGYDESTAVTPVSLGRVLALYYPE